MTLGNATVKLSCGHIVDLGFVYDLETWAEGYKEQEIICPICGSRGLYSWKNLVLTPAKTDLKE
jgi:DNA-directed RNA polymerase subunit RPC12/RpoP